MRYNEITAKFPREIVLLKGKDCSYGKCKFCNYTEDNDQNIENLISTNLPVLEQVTGKHQVLEVINSGNVFDLDDITLSKISDIVITKQIKILYFECYLNHINKLQQIRQLFPTCEVRFRLGLETFNDEYRKYLGKPFIYDSLATKIEDNYYSVCLMVCLTGQTKEQIIRDIELGLNKFKQITINVFVNNGTEITADDKLKKWFIQEQVPKLKDHPQVELLIDNKDLGVFEQ